MALKGTLKDMAIIDLVQFPHSGRKTGQLVISGTDGEARLAYQNGSLVHATLGEASGIDALVSVVGWLQGSFEFLPDVEPEVRSIEMDLHRAVMQALKMHDELKREEAERQAKETSKGGAGEEDLIARLSEFAGATDFALHVCVLDSNGKVRASVNGPEGVPERIDEIRTAVHSLVQTYPRSPIRRLLLEDDFGTVALVGFQGGDSLIVVANKEASIGSVSMSIGRLASRLQ
jgi:hypothetical protein